MHLVSLASLATCLAGLAAAHMEMRQPYAIRSKFNPANQATQNIDYSMTSPLLADGSNYPCKGYQNDRPAETVATYKAGSTYQLQLAGTATHNGGSCQLSLSYDNGKTFRVIKSMIGGCPLTSTYDFTIPDFAPNGTALFAWSWQNHSGNREFYMNCAEVAIDSSVSTTKLRRARNPRTRRETFTSFDQLPGIWQANLPPQNDCTTVEGEDPVYPNPGPQVEYGSGLSPASPTTPGTCDNLTPPGPTYKDLSPDAAGSEDSGDVDSGSIAEPSSSSAQPLFTPGQEGRISSTVVRQTMAPSATSSSVFTSSTSTIKSSAISAFSSPTSVPVSTSSSSTSAQKTSKITTSPTSSAASSTKTKASQTPSSSTVTATPAATSTPDDNGPVAAGAPCATDGSFGCLRSGQGFAVCDHSRWVDMGSVAAGTICEGDAGEAKLVADLDSVRALQQQRQKEDLAR